jgi:hypothetical protein
LTNTPPVEACNSSPQRERLDQHAHASRRPPAGDGERDVGLIQLAYRRLRGVGQHLVLGDQRTVHVGQE